MHRSRRQRRRTGGRLLRLSLPPLDLDLVVRSHGWYDLPPFEWQAPNRRLRFVYLEDGEPISVEVQRVRAGLVVRAGPAGASSRASVRRVVRRVLDLDVDLSEFHALCRRDRSFAWIARRGAGRILRAPTLFEDAAKVLATTNCTWALTKVMVKNLIAAFGRGGAFPDAEFVAGLPEARLRTEIRVGYRAPYFSRFAEKVASGTLDLSRWEDPARPDEDVEKEIRSLKGFGPYATETLGRLLNRHGRLGLDSWSRRKVAELRFGGRRVKDARVEKVYRAFGRHAGLAFWLDVTREWHGRKEKLWP